MKAPLVVVTLALVLGASACNNGDARDSGSGRAQVAISRSSTTPQQAAGDAGGRPKTLTEAQLKSALLTVGDVPSGYSVDPAPSNDDGSTAGDSAECSRKFDLVSGGDTGPANAAAKVYFKGEQVATILQEKLMSYQDAQSLSDQFSKVADLPAQCTRFSRVDAQGVKSDYTIRALSFPRLGEDSKALAISVETPQFRGAADVAVIRLGHTLMVFTQGGITADARTLEQAARQGLTKLAAASR